VKVDYKYRRDQWREGLTAAQQHMARAATKTMRQLAKEVEVAARAEIGRGLSARNARAFFARAKPKSGYSIATSMRGYLRIGYLNIFERGGTIRPKNRKYLWVPLSNAPRSIRVANTTATARTKTIKKGMTPERYIKEIGPLSFVSHPGKAPLLVGEVTVGASSPNITIARLRTGARNAAARRAGRKGRRTVHVPIFVGIPIARIADRLNVDRVYREAAARLPKVYAEQMASEAQR
jgi:hypothetical protein